MSFDIKMLQKKSLAKPGREVSPDFCWPFVG